MIVTRKAPSDFWGDGRQAGQSVSQSERQASQALLNLAPLGRMRRKCHFHLEAMATSRRLAGHSKQQPLDPAANLRLPVAGRPVERRQLSESRCKIVAVNIELDLTMMLMMI